MARLPDFKRRIYESYMSSGHLKVDPSAPIPPDPARHPRQAAIRRFFPSNRDARILDLGCGYGGFTKIAQDMGYHRAEGVDVAESLIAEGLRRKVKNLRVGDLLETLRETDGESYDVVSVLDVLEHLTGDEAFEVLDHVYRVLVPGGGVLIHVPNGGAVFPTVVRYGDFTHERAFTDRSLSQVLGTVGFTEIQVSEDRIVAHGLKSWVRAAIWTVGVFPFRLLHLAETGETNALLTQNVWGFARRPRA